MVEFADTAMTDHADQDHAHVLVRPPLLWLLTIACWALDWAVPLPFVPAGWPHIWIGAAVFAAGFLLAVWAFRQFRDFRADVSTHTATTHIASTGAFRYSRNPIYLGMALGIVGVAVGVDSLWVLIGLIAWYPIIRWGVIAREEAYLEGKFGDEYRAYKARVRRWF